MTIAGFSSFMTVEFLKSSIATLDLFNSFSSQSLHNWQSSFSLYFRTPQLGHAQLHSVHTVFCAAKHFLIIGDSPEMF